MLVFILNILSAPLSVRCTWSCWWMGRIAIFMLISWLNMKSFMKWWTNNVGEDICFEIWNLLSSYIIWVHTKLKVSPFLWLWSLVAPLNQEVLPLIGKHCFLNKEVLTKTHLFHLHVPPVFAILLDIWFQHKFGMKNMTL